MPSREITRSLTDGHRNMERVLTLIRFQLDSMREEEGGEPPNFKLLGNAFVYMRDYPGVNHHPVEEMIFDKLVGYVPEHRLVCSQLTGQHKSFGGREEGLIQHIRRARLGDEMARRHVKDLGIAYCAEHSSHIRSEEVDVLPGATRWLTPTDWQEVARRSRATIDPGLEQRELKRYDNLYDRLMMEEGDAAGEEAVSRGAASRD